MHVVRLRGIQVQLDNSWAITMGLCVLQQHKCPYGRGDVNATVFSIQKLTHALSYFNFFTLLQLLRDRGNRPCSYTMDAKCLRSAQYDVQGYEYEGVCVSACVTF